VVSGTHDRRRRGVATGGTRTLRSTRWYPPSQQLAGCSGTRVTTDSGKLHVRRPSNDQATSY
jgi:hypothetical protein